MEEEENWDLVWRYGYGGSKLHRSDYCYEVIVEATTTQAGSDALLRLEMWLLYGKEILVMGRGRQPSRATNRS